MRTTSIVSIIAAAAVAVCVLAPDARAVPDRIRYNIKDTVDNNGMPLNQQQLFVDAMFALRRMAPGVAPANSNEPQNRYEEYVRAHDTNKDFIHFGTSQGAVWFLPWHRQLLFQMENDVRAMGQVMVPDPMAPGGTRQQDFSNFALPYWDGTRDAYPMDVLGGNGAGANNYVDTGPFANPDNINCPCKWQDYSPTGDGTTITGASRNPLRRQFDAMTGGKFDKLTTNGPASVKAYVGVPGDPAFPGAADYEGLSCGDGTKGLEAAPGLHNAHHEVVGGQLGNPVSGSTDPAFWLLHAFTDLLWARWEATHGTDYSAPTGTTNHGLNDPMTGVGTTGTFGLTELNTAKLYRPDGSVTPADVLNYWTMPGGGYTYDYRPNPNTEDRELLGPPVPEPATLGLLLSLAVVLPRSRRSTFPKVY